MGAPGRRGGVGLRAAEVQRRRVPGPLAGGLHAAGHRVRVHRPAAHVDRCPRDVLAAAASGHRHGRGAFLAQRHHAGRFARRRLRGQVVRLLRRPEGLRGAVHARMGVRGDRARPRPHPRVRTLLRQGRARRHPVGPGLRHAERLHPAVPDGERHHERVRQHRQAGHEPAGAQRLRHQSRLRHGPAVLPAGDVRQEAHGGRGASRLRALHRHGRLRRREPGLRDGQALSHEDVLVAGRQRHHLHGQRRAAHLPDAGERGVLRGGRPVPHAHGRRLRRHLPAPEDHRRARLHARVVDAAARHEVGQPVVRGEVRRRAASWLWATR